MFDRFILDISTYDPPHLFLPLVICSSSRPSQLLRCELEQAPLGDRSLRTPTQFHRIERISYLPIILALVFIHSLISSIYPIASYPWPSLSDGFQPIIVPCVSNHGSHESLDPTECDRCILALSRHYCPSYFVHVKHASKSLGLCLVSLHRVRFLAPSCRTIFSLRFRRFPMDEEEFSERLRIRLSPPHPLNY